MNNQFGQDKGASNQAADRAAPERSAQVLGASEILAMMARGWWILVLCTVLAVLSAAAITIVRSPTYTAQVNLLVKIGRERFTAIEVAPLERPNVVFQDRPEGINNEVEILRDGSLTVAVFPELQAELESMRRAAEQALMDAPPSLTRSLRLFARDAQLWLRDMMASVREPLYTIGLLEPISDDDALMLRFHRAFNVQAVKQADVLTASFAWDNPQFAAFALGRYIEAYQQRHVAVHAQTDAAHVYRDQVTSAREEAEAAERALTDFQRATGLTSPEAERTTAVQELLRLQREHIALGIEIDDLDLRRQQVLADAEGRSLWSATPESLATPAIVVIDERAVDLLLRIDALTEQVTADAPELRRAEAELERLRERKLRLMLQQIDNEQASRQARANILEAQIATQRAALETLSVQELQHQRLSETMALRRDMLRDYERLIERLRIGELLDRLSITSIHPISEVMPPLRPSGPRTLVVLAVAAVVGLMIGMLLALLRGIAGTRPRTPEDTAKGLGVPVAPPMARPR